MQKTRKSTRPRGVLGCAQAGLLEQGSPCSQLTQSVCVCVFVFIGNAPIVSFGFSRLVQSCPPVLSCSVLPYPSYLCVSCSVPSIVLSWLRRPLQLVLVRFACVLSCCGLAKPFVLQPSRFHATSLVIRMEITPDPKRPRLNDSCRKAPRHDPTPPSMSAATILEGKVISTMAAELTSALASANKRLEKPREHRFATMCSGSEICHEVLKALEQELGKIGVQHSFKQLFAAESVPKKQAWIAKVVRDPSICIFNDFQVKSNKFLELPRNFVFMTISGSHPCCFDYGTFLSRFLWPCRDKFQVAARANWNAIFGLA